MLRAYEIAKAGNFGIHFYYHPELYQRAEEDIKRVFRPLFGENGLRQDVCLHFQLPTPNFDDITVFDDVKQDSLFNQKIDIVNISEIKLNPSFEMSSFIKTMIIKGKLGNAALQDVITVSKVIAAIGGKKTVGLEHIAEAFYFVNIDTEYTKSEN